MTDVSASSPVAAAVSPSSAGSAVVSPSSPSSSSSSSSRPPTLLSVLEFVVHLSDFKNLDLFRQGLYYVRSSIYTVQTDETGKKSKQTLAMPYHLITPPSPIPLSPIDSSVIFYPAFIDEAKQLFASRTFRIQYCDQVVELNDVCLFRLEANARQRATIHLEMELMFCDFSQQDLQNNIDPPAPDCFERVSCKTYQLHHIYTGGIHSYIPVTFDEAHFCLIQCMIHSMLLEFRFRLTWNPSTTSSRIGEGSGINYQASQTRTNQQQHAEESHSVSSPSLRSYSSTTESPSAVKESDITVAWNDSIGTDSPTSSDLPHRDTNNAVTYPPFALVLFPRLAALHNSNNNNIVSSTITTSSSFTTAVSASSPSSATSSPSSSSSSSSSSTSLYTDSELSSLADRYYMFFMSNMIRAYNQLAITFDTYLRQCLNAETREALKNKGIVIKPLVLPASCIKKPRKATAPQQQSSPSSPQQSIPERHSTDDIGIGKKDKEAVEEKKAEGPERLLRPAAIITNSQNNHLNTDTATATTTSNASSAGHQAERHKRPSSPASPSILPPSSPLPTHSSTADTTNHLTTHHHAVIPSPPASPLPTASPSSSSAASSSTATTEYDSMLAATQRYHARRRRSHDHRDEVDYHREREDFLQHTALLDKYSTPALARLSTRLKQQRQLHYSAIATVILQDLLCIQTQSFQLWNIFIQLLPLLTPRLLLYCIHQWEQVCLDHWSAFVFRESYSIDHRFKVVDESMMETHAEIATIARKNAAVILPLLPMIEVENLQPLAGAPGAVNDILAQQQQQLQKDRGGLMGDHDNQVVVFEEAYSRKPSVNVNRPTSPRMEQRSTENDSSNVEEEDGGDRPAVSPRPHHHHSSMTAEDGLSLSAIGLTMNPTQSQKEIAEVDVDHSTLVSTHGVDSRPLPTAIKEKQQQDQQATNGQSSQRHNTSQQEELLSTTTVPTATAVNTAAIGTAPPSATTATTASDSPSGACASSSTSSYVPPVKLVNKSGKHVFILCHGYQGNSWDMRLFKNQLSLLFPNALLILSSSNENNTEGDIAEMGERLAYEAHTAIVEHCNPNTGGLQLGQLSFIAHSLGGLIVRAALTHPTLLPYLPYCHTFITLATPHLGYIYAENSWLSTGLWFLKKWNKSLCLSQLSLTDGESLESCYLYRLSLFPLFQYFEHVFLFASQQDKYVPFHSARIEHCMEAEHDVKKGRIYQKMVNNLLANIEHVSIKRFDLQFVNKKKNLDSLIGRAAHIFFLDQMGYMQLLLNVYKQYLI